jgi:hypothetical protein
MQSQWLKWPKICGTFERSSKCGRPRASSKSKIRIGATDLPHEP